MNLMNKKMRQVRLGVFETNSSSTHSLVVCTKEEYEKWKSGELLYGGNNKFLTNEEALDKIKEYQPDITSIDDAEDLYEFDIFTFDSWGEDYEEETNEYTTKSGDEIVIRSYYGYQG